MFLKIPVLKKKARKKKSAGIPLTTIPNSRNGYQGSATDKLRNFGQAAPLVWDSVHCLSGVTSGALSNQQPLREELKGTEGLNHQANVNFNLSSDTDAFELWCWRTLESSLDNKKIQPVHPKGISPEYSLEGLMLKLKLQYFGHLMWRTDSLEKTNAGKDWRWEEKGTTEDEMVGWHHRLNGHEFE